MRDLIRNHYKDYERLLLFESALKGEKEYNKLSVGSRLDIDIQGINIEKISSIIKEYKKYYNSIAYPFNYIKGDMKYHFIAKYIQSKINGLEFIIDNDLRVYEHKEKIGIRFINDTYSITDRDLKHTVTKIDTDKFKDTKYYNEYNFIYSAIKLKGEVNPIVIYTGMYKEIYNEFKENLEDIEEYIRSLASIVNVPKFNRLVDNVIVDLDEQSEYTLELFTNGVKKTLDNKFVISSYKDMELKPKYTEIYDYNARKRKKELTGTYVKYEITHSDLIGLHCVFNKIIGIKKAHELENFPLYRGLIVNRNIILEINNSIFIGKAYRKSEMEEVASNCKLLGVKDNKIYYCIKDSSTKDISVVRYYAYIINRSEHEFVGSEFI